MQDDSTPTPAERWDTMERTVLYLLTGDDLPIWSVQDIGREIDDPKAAVVVVRNLVSAGLVNQTSEGHVFPTRAASRMVQLVGQVI